MKHMILRVIASLLALPIIAFGYVVSWVDESWGYIRDALTIRGNR